MLSKLRIIPILKQIIIIRHVKSMGKVSLKNLGAYCRGINKTSIRRGDLATNTKTKTLEDCLKNLYKICT